MQYFVIYIFLLFCLICFISNKKQESFNTIIDDFIPLTNYPELNILEQNTSIILDELDYILKNEYWSNYDDLHGKDVFKNNDINYVMNELIKSESKINEQPIEPKWKMFGLIFNKQSLDKNIDVCPITISLLKSIPCVINAGFSCLEPNKTTDLHSDDNNNFYRYQLPLIIPSGDTGFTVNKSTISYKLNEPFIFNDSNMHQAWNNTNKIRVVLICDIHRKK